MVSENLGSQKLFVCTFLSIYYHIFQLFWLDIKKWAGTHLTVWTSLEFCSSSWKSIRLSKANLVIVSGIFSFAVAGVIHEYGLKWCKDSRLLHISQNWKETIWTYTYSPHCNVQVLVPRKLVQGNKNDINHLRD